MTAKAYSRVEAIYRYGCNICLQYGRALTRDRHNNQLVCDTCIDSFTEVANTKLQEITNQVNSTVSAASDNAFPPPKRTKSGENGEIAAVNGSAGNTNGAEAQ